MNLRSGDVLVLVGCETSGTVREAFRALGHDAWSCDLLPADDASPFHVIGDVRDVMDARPWDLAIFHPPCTRLCNSGVRWLAERDLWDEMREGAELFAACLHSKVKRRAIENPVMHKHAKAAIHGYVEWTQTVQPWMFGDPERKRTCLWLFGLPKLVETNRVKPTRASVHHASPSADRWKVRSKTFPGMAKAFAEQWGCADCFELEV